MDLEDLIKKINEKEFKKEECLESPSHIPMYEDNSWVLILLLLLLFDFPKKEQKEEKSSGIQPVIVISMGDDE